MQTGNGASSEDPLALAKLAMTYVGILDDEWHDLPDDERRDLVAKAKDAIIRLGSALERGRGA
ncbi:MAG: hypothetical protein ACRDKT_05155 [Actinomycetota bacterium]